MWWERKRLPVTPLYVDDMRAMPVGGAARTVSDTAEPAPEVGDPLGGDEQDLS